MICLLSDAAQSYHWRPPARFMHGEYVGRMCALAGKDSGVSRRTADSAASAQAAWQPSSRVLALSPEQVAELRTRLNVVVEDGAAADKPVTVAPVESFDDMVRSGRRHMKWSCCSSLPLDDEKRVQHELDACTYDAQSPIS